jgi:hypothetical protein
MEKRSMPMRETDPQDPMELVGVSALGSATGRLETMAECFAEEFIRLGHSEEAILDLFRSPFYAGPHRAYRELGEARIREMITHFGRIFRPIKNG